MIDGLTTLPACLATNKENKLSDIKAWKIVSSLLDCFDMLFLLGSREAPQKRYAIMLFMAVTISYGGAFMQRFG